jgi:putative addiction module killer protein
MSYNRGMFEIRESLVFATWLAGLRDSVTRTRIQARILRLAHGNPGQHRALTEGVVELKLDFGPGYRVYYVQRGRTLIVLLCGGEKASQQADIANALKLAAALETDSANREGNNHGKN